MMEDPAVGVRPELLDDSAGDCQLKVVKGEMGAAAAATPDREGPHRCPFRAADRSSRRRATRPLSAFRG
jgi:hypothetical protein